MTKSGNKEYSPCWVDYGYLWRENNTDPLSHVNSGTYVYPPVFEKGKTFDFFCKMINVPVDYPCSFGLALVDKEENIVTVIPANMKIEEGNYSVFCAINYTWNGVKLSTIMSLDYDLPENYTLWVASQKEGSNKWELIPGTMEAPSKCRFGDEGMPLSNINYSFKNVIGTLGDPENDTNDFVYSVNKVDPTKTVIGSGYWGKYKANNGIANIYLNGNWVSNTDDTFETFIQLMPIDNHYDIDINYIRNDDLQDIQVNCDTPGTIKDILQNYTKIKSLTIKGNLNAEDLYFISHNCVSLQHLDISNVNLCPYVDGNKTEYLPNIFPPRIYSPTDSLNDGLETQNIWGIKSLKLPHSMTGWCPKTIDPIVLCGRNLVSLSIPVNHISDYPEYYYDDSHSLGDYSYQFVNCLIENINDTISNVKFPDYVKKYGHLFVPIGMGEKFQAAPGWNEFKYILEVDKPFEGKIIDKDGAKYILLSDCAVLLSAPFNCFHSHFAMADEIIYNNSVYPVKYIASQSLLARDITHIELPEYFDTLDLNVFFGSRSITLNNNLKQIIPKDDTYHIGGFIYLKNNDVLDLSNMDSFVAFTDKLYPNFVSSNKISQAYVPGASIANFNLACKNVENFIEMWNYQIDRFNNLALIKPQIDEIVIDKVKINGEIITPIADYYYNLPNAIDLDIEISYTLHNRQAMCTHYTPEFNTALPDINLTSIKLNKTKEQLFIGEIIQLEASVEPSISINKSIIWSSSNETVATVDEFGKVTAAGVGVATITATCGSVSATCKVTVKPILAESLTIDPQIWKGIEGGSFKITAVVKPDNTTDKTLLWNTSNSIVAPVDDKGLVTVLKSGTCVVSVSTVDGSNLTSECVITSMSGIDGIFADEDATVDVYTTNGLLFKRQCSKAELKQLTPGVYIIKSNKGETTTILLN